MAIMDFRFEDDEDDLSDDEGMRRRRGKSKILKTIRKRMSVVKPLSNLSRGSHQDDDEDYSSDEDDNFRFKRVQRRLRKKKSGSSSPDHGEKKKKRSSSGLRMSRSKEANDEEDDVAMPLPGQSADAVSVAHSHGSKRSASKKRGFRLIKNALAKNNSDNHSVSSMSLQSTSVGTGKSGKKRPQPRKKSTGSEGSNESPPSVASTEISMDHHGGTAASNQHYELRQQQARAARKNAKQNKNALNNLFQPGKRQMDEMTGAAMEAMSMDYYYQSIPWIIKTWIYFLTVVVPFTLLYYCFVGIFHSASLNQNPFLKHVAISNLVFIGAGCTFKTDFFARQALDSKGQFSKGVVAPLPSLERKFTNGGTPIKRVPRNRRGVGFKDQGNSSPNGLNRMLTAIPLPLPRVDTIKGAFRPKQRKTSNPNTNNPTGIKNVAGQLSSRLLSQMSTGSERQGKSARLLDPGKPRSARVLDSTAPTPSTPTTSNATTSSSSPQRPKHNRGASNGSSNNHNTSPTKPTATNPPSPTNNNTSSSPMSPRNSGSTSSSIWDVEHMIPQRSKSSGKPNRRSLDKHTSILEIYEVHAKDEKVGLLQ